MRLQLFIFAEKANYSFKVFGQIKLFLKYFLTHKNKIPIILSVKLNFGEAILMKITKLNKKNIRIVNTQKIIIALLSSRT